MNLWRPVIYAAGALAGVAFVDHVRPVDARAAVNAGAGSLGSLSWSALEKAGGAAADALKGQIRANIVTGVVAGCAAAALVDALLLRR